MYNIFGFYKFKKIEQFVFQDLFDKDQPYDVVPSVTVTVNEWDVLVS